MISIHRPAAGMKAVLLALFLSMCLPALAGAQAMMLPVDPTPLVAVTASGSTSISIEIADDSGERERGLMFRRDLKADHGMLFVFDETRRLAFWMKNTPLPLDLVFVGQNGLITAILPGQPYSEAVISPNAPARFVLELNAGMAEKLGLRSGVRLRHPAIDKIAGAD